MKIKKLLISSLLGLIATSAFARPGVIDAPNVAANANFVFTLVGTNTVTTGVTTGPNGTFSFSIRLNYPGPVPADVLSLSYWFEVATSIGPFIKITNQTNTAVNGDPNSPSPWNVLATQATDYPMPFNVAADSGFVRDAGASANGDLGAGGGAGQPPSGTTYYVSTLTFQLTNAPLGSFLLQTTTSPPTSVSNSSGAFFTLPTATFLVTVVPEPATWSLIGLGALGLVGVNMLRARRKS